MALWQKILLSLVILCGIGARLIALDKLPVLFDGDETYLGYYGYTLLQRGTDEFGVKLPLYFSSIGDFKYPVYSYLATVPVKILGLTRTSTRLPSAIFGILTIGVVLWLGSKLFSSKVGFWAAGLMSLNIWHIFLSRKALESTVGLLFVTLTTALWIRLWRKFTLRSAILTVILSTLGYYCYPATRIFLILLFGFFSVATLWQRKYLHMAIALLIAIIGVMTFISPESRARGQQINITSESYLKTALQKNQIEIQAAGFAQLPAPVTRLFSNKYFTLGRDFVFKWVEQFNPSFYLTHGDDRPRFGLAKSGYLTLIEAVLIFVALVHVSRLPRRIWLPFGVWSLAATFPSALTTENPHPVRLILLIPVLVLLAAYGASLIRSKIVWSILLVLWVTNLGYGLYQGVIQKTYNQPWNNETVLSGLPKTLAPHMAKYAKIVIPGDPYVFFLFTHQTDPIDFVNTAVIEPDRFSWDRVTTFDKLIFKAPGKCPSTGKLGVLYVCFDYILPRNAKVIDYATFLDGVPAYSLVEFVSTDDDANLTTPARFVRQPNTNTGLRSDGLIPDDYPTYWP